MKYRKKPIVIDAFKWDGTDTSCESWLLEKRPIRTNAIFPQDIATVQKMLIETLEGTMTAFPGDYIIRGIKGEIYPCKADIFEASYEAVE